MLTRREVEARVLVPIIEALGKEFGRERVIAVLQATITGIAEEQGAALCERMGGNSLAHFHESLRFWIKGNALEIDVIEQTDDVLSFNVTRCRYAELYEALGPSTSALGMSFSCTRDFALLKGFNPNITLRRTQTLMEGAQCCDFRLSTGGCE
ncbi:MAG: L-2-amino-thiazoline-4-carboxylic acid hydrolase [Gammaproteobacteria bacterium]|nr:L-2-amino-thiazoline-4-carboxylic acid hydrolase [Gammaproteobacteria bacterium]NNJ84602.1 L-2-amino-thiazoline-4-carboxylic acid hydrolase [Gammaproteobacteria bacterium]